MTKDRYTELRKGPRFLFLYYLEEGGFLKEEQGFKNMLKMWFDRGGVQWRTGITMVVKYLDDKHQYTNK